MKPKILDSSKVEEVVRRRGWTNIEWGSGDNKLNPFMRCRNRHYTVENVRFILRGRPKDYINPTDPYYWEDIAVEIMSKGYRETKGYKWVKGQITKKYIREGDNFIN